MLHVPVLQHSFVIAVGKLTFRRPLILDFYKSNIVKSDCFNEISSDIIQNCTDLVIELQKLVD